MIEQVITPLPILQDIADTVKEATGVEEIPVLKLNEQIQVALENGGGADTSDATAMATDILEGKTAYVADGKVAGTFTIAEEIATQDDLISRIQIALQDKAVSGGVRLPEISNPATANDILFNKEAIDAEGELIVGTMRNAENDLVERAFTTYANTTVSNIGNYAFTYYRSLTTVSFPMCINIGSNAFASCSNLVSLSFPNCANIGSCAFQWCSKLTSANFPLCTSIGSNAFYYCGKLTSIDFPICRNIQSGAFSNCSSLKSINFPVCTSIGSDAFAYCSNLSSVNLPTCEYIGNGAFRSCSKITSIELPVCSYIGSSAFYYCSKLSVIKLLSTSVTTLSNHTAFQYTPISNSAYIGGYGSIYVHYYLLSLYQKAQNWSNYASRFVALPGIHNIEDPTVPMNGMKRIFVDANFTTNPSNVSVITQENNEIITISNIQATKNGITFDASASSEAGEIEITISASDNGTNYQNIFILKVVHPIGDLTEKIQPNTTKTIIIPFDPNGTAPNNVDIISSDNNILTISNIIYNSENVTCDITSYDTEVETSINVSIVHNGFTYTKDLYITIKSEPEYFVENLDTDYGFILNSSEYYESSNKGIDNSFALCKLNITAPYDCTMYLDCINSGESNYDYGILSKLDTELTKSVSDDSSSNVQKTFRGLSSSDIQTVSYTIPTGEHYVYIKFKKDGSSFDGNDSLQFKVRFEE